LDDAAIGDSVEVISNYEFRWHQTSEWRTIEQPMRLAISVAWGAGGKRNHLGDSVLAKAKPARYPVGP
jgi:hypothetical protein